MYKLTDTYTLSNGIQIPCFGLGTYLSTADEGKTSITAAIDAGYRLIDTASRYANEDVVGNAIKDCEISREEIFITSKVWNDCRGYDNVMRSFERTMKAIGLEYIDLLLVHWPANKKQHGDSAEALNAETWRAFEDICDLLRGIILVIVKIQYHPVLFGKLFQQSGKDLFGIALDVLFLHQKGDGRIACIQRGADDLGAFGNEYTFFRLKLVSQLSLGKPRVSVQLRRGEITYFYNVGHKDPPWGFL